jgi:hypothetical protein
MYKIKSPKTIADTINIVFSNPLTENDIRIRIVEMMKPEFRMTL